MGEANLATAEKGKQVYDEATKQLARFASWFKDRPKDERKLRHRKAPTMPMPWGQRPIEGSAPPAKEVAPHTNGKSKKAKVAKKR
jgi:hypothetical protein